MNDNKVRIMKCAAVMFAQKGYSGAGLNEIVKSADVPKGSFYYYFKDGKEQLMIETLWFAYESMMKEIKANFLKGAHNPTELFEKMTTRLATLINETYLESLLISLIGIETSKSNTKINNEIQKIYKLWQEEYKGMLLGFNLSEEDAEHYRIIYFSLVHGALISSYIKHDNHDLLLTKEVLKRFE